ncbi:arylesterase [Pseudomonas sp. R2.Fl]|nr:arylesterase [Pseudomonas sp. R2.Fl]
MGFKAAALQFTVILATLLFSLVPASGQERVVKLVGFGDSLMAGYQLPPQDALPTQLQRKLQAKGVAVEIVNAGVSGDTSAGGRSRVDWSVPDGTDGVILELGANDALRGLSPAETEANLEAIIGRLNGRGIAVLLVGMLAPPNMGSDYADAFNPIYPKLAEKHRLAFYPFVLEGVVTKSELQLDDGMHPNGEGVAVMADGMLPVTQAFVEEILKKRK